MSNIKLFQLSRVWEQIGEEVLSLTNDSHCKGEAQNGEVTKRLESALALRYNRQYCITTASGTDALDIALQALELPKKCPISVNNYTFTASAHAIQRAGYTVMPTDVNDNYCISPGDVKSCLAIMPVDLFGNMSDYNELSRLNLPMVVDAAQSMESHDGIHWSAEYGIASCLSFSPSKPITSFGSGGAILTNDSNFALRCQQLRLHGKIKNDNMAIAPGLNSMMSSAECISVLCCLNYANEWRQRRQEIAEYIMSVSKYPCAIDLSIKQHTLSKLVFQSDAPDVVIKNLHDKNIDCVVHYRKLINDENIYRTNNMLNKSNFLKNISFTVPNQHTLTDNEVERIAKALQ